MIQGITKISIPPSATALGGILLAMPWTWGLTYCIYSLHSKGPYLFTMNMDNLSQYVSNCCKPVLSNFLSNMSCGGCSLLMVVSMLEDNPWWLILPGNQSLGEDVSKAELDTVAGP
jgi:hypothetical protein